MRTIKIDRPDLARALADELAEQTGSAVSMRQAVDASLEAGLALAKAGVFKLSPSVRIPKAGAGARQVAQA